MTAPRTATRQRWLGRSQAVGLVVALGLALFGSTLPTWVRGTAPTIVGSTDVAVGGADAAPGVPSAALVILVAGLVLGLSGRLTRVLAVIGVVLGGVLAAASAAAFVADPVPALRQAAGTASGATEIEGGAIVTPWPWVALVLAVLTVAAGAVLPRVSRGWAQVGRRYETGGTRAAPSSGPQSTPRARAMDDWDALSRGDDPTEDEPGAG